MTRPDPRLSEQSTVRTALRIGGPIIPASAYLMKSPPVQIEDTEGRAMLEAFIRGE